MTRKKVKIDWHRFISLEEGWKSSKGLRAIIFLALIVLFYIILADKLVPRTYDIRQGEQSERAVVAPRQMENGVATEKAREQAASAVKPVYKVFLIQHNELIDTIYDRIEHLNADLELTYDEKKEIYRDDLPKYFDNAINAAYKEAQASGQYNQSLLDEMKEKTLEQKYSIAEESYFKMTRLTTFQLGQMRGYTKQIVSDLMKDEQIQDAGTVRVKVAELVLSSDLRQSIERDVVKEIIRFALTPNSFFDAHQTEQEKLRAKNETPVISYEKGDVIVKPGETITPELYDRLSSLDLVKDKSQYGPQFGLLLLVLLMVSLLYMFIRQSNSLLKENNVQLLLLSLLLLLNLLAMKIVAMWQEVGYEYLGYIAPIAMGTMLIAILLDSYIAVVSSILFSIFAGFILNTNHEQLFDIKFGLTAFVISFTAVFAINKASQRSTVIRAGVIVSLLSLVAISAMNLIDGYYALKPYLLSLAFATGGGLFTVVLVIGLLPLFELIFGMLSPLKLIELSNPNHPLLRKLLTETPGTYHHSVMVGNLSEAAAEAIGADGLLCRVGSFYHDIGKTKRPSYFIENQTNIENPHDSIDPELSKSIIIAHARDGVEMLKEYKMPKQIRDIAEQHHGTTLLKFFLFKARKQAEDKELDPLEITEEQYRYPGPKAQSKEAAIVGIADSVEAAVRSLKSPNIETIDSMVHKIIKERMEDNQFNDCDLTLKELDTIRKTLKETLVGIFHSRIEYPDLPDKPNKG